VLALAVSGDSSHWPDLRQRAETLAEEQGLSLEPLHASRLLALWERPQFVWKLVPATDDPAPLLKAMARWSETRRLGLMRVSSEKTALHPPQTLERVDCPLSDLKAENALTGAFNEPCLIHWRTSP
jgi:3,4-dihydroxy 2-butanone 4-phosphate synthase/GTP cyclohydrolase II